VPILGAVNAFYYPNFLHKAKTSPLILQKLLPNILQILQAVLITVFATLLLQDVSPGTTLSCVLGTRWQKLFAEHNGGAIRKIQDMLDCCGFNSAKDRAWPFPGSGASATCAESSHRTAACVGPWTAALQRNSGLDLGVVLAVAVFQVCLFCSGARTCLTVTDAQKLTV